MSKDGKTDSISGNQLNTQQKREQKYNLILSRSTNDVGGHLSYLGGLMTSMLSKYKKLNKKVKKQIQEFPMTHALGVLGGFYDSLYHSREGLKVFDPALNLESPNLDLKNYNTDKEKIEALKNAIEKGIGQLQSLSQDKATQEFAKEFHKQYTTFTNNLDDVNQKVQNNAVGEAKRLGLINIKQGLLDRIAFKDSKGNFLSTTDKQKNRAMFAPLLEKIILPDNIVDVYINDPSISKNNSVGLLLQPLAEKFFTTQGAFNEKNFNDPALQNKFAREANKKIEKFVKESMKKMGLKSEKDVNTNKTLSTEQNSETRTTRIINAITGFSDLTGMSKFSSKTPESGNKQKASPLPASGTKNTSNNIASSHKSPNSSGTKPLPATATPADTSPALAEAVTGRMQKKLQHSAQTFEMQNKSAEKLKHGNGHTALKAGQDIAGAMPHGQPTGTSNRPVKRIIGPRPSGQSRV